MQTARPAFLVPVVVSAALRSAAVGPAAAGPVAATYVETDPSTFALGGFALHVRVAPTAAPRWTIGLGVYALDLPAVMTELAPANRDEGWEVRIRLGYGLFVDRFLDGPGRGWFAGVQLAAQHLRVRDPRLGPEAADSIDLLAMPRAGYLWRPFDAGFYLAAWLGVGATGRVAGDTRVGADRYEVLPVVAFGAVHVGWTF